jgi:hypothetical protein
MRVRAALGPQLSRRSAFHSKKRPPRRASKRHGGGVGLSAGTRRGADAFEATPMPGAVNEAS